MKNKMVIGTRGSVLALRQAEIVSGRLRAVRAGIDFDILKIKTKGDKILDVSLSKIGGKGLFTKEIENALLDGSADIAVHSLKDLPTEMPEGLTLGAVLVRDNPLDTLISRGGETVDTLPKGAIIGTSSLRRKSQLAKFRGDLAFKDLRGNLDTRLRKLSEGEFDAIVLSTAGLDRLGITDVHRSHIPPSVSLPAVGQGTIAIQCREGDADALELLRAVDHAETRVAVEAERALMSELEGGCQVPIGALGRLDKNVLTLEACIADLNGEVVFRGSVSGPPETADAMGRSLARKLLAMGGDRIMREIRETL